MLFSASASCISAEFIVETICKPESGASTANPAPLCQLFIQKEWGLGAGLRKLENEKNIKMQNKLNIRVIGPITSPTPVQMKDFYRGLKVHGPSFQASSH